MTIPNDRGNIINTASIASTFGGAASYAYTSSKHGMLGLQDRKLKHEMVWSGVNASGIISLSSGLDLSGLFTGEKRKEKRYGSTASVERVVERVMRGVAEIVKLFSLVEVGLAKGKAEFEDGQWRDLEAELGDFIVSWHTDSVEN
ncbi:hypothetical protein SLEP1_g463 [Rubroshorea leprosula]|uniref:NAF domain-containing protein n=1 Tax=Rubroshorea leprosula TaxID=152421 RepID=A0AAV5HAI2_9ROSI|nr:hypothetical protein SLEP1_g463 [Rubroshorea leprosula]